jgi:hypothetical protein
MHMDHEGPSSCRLRPRMSSSAPFKLLFKHGLALHPLLEAVAKTRTAKTEELESSTMSSDSDNEKRAGGVPPLTDHNETESNEPPAIIDKATERRLMRKLDARIVWVVMWTYLMNFMDRVNIGNARLYGLEEDLGLTGNQFQISVSILYVFPPA